LGEIRDRSFEQQRYRASGLNLVTERFSVLFQGAVDKKHTLMRMCDMISRATLQSRHRGNLFL
jgi:hypothetical protein